MKSGYSLPTGDIHTDCEVFRQCLLHAASNVSWLTKPDRTYTYDAPVVYLLHSHVTNWFHAVSEVLPRYVCLS